VLRGKGFEVVGASGFEPPTSWSRTRENYSDSVPFISCFDRDLGVYEYSDEGDQDSELTVISVRG